MYYYDDETMTEITEVDSLDLSQLDNLVIDSYDGFSQAYMPDDEKITELLALNGMDITQCKNVYKDMPYLYNKDTDEYLK